MIIKILINLEWDFNVNQLKDYQKLDNLSAQLNRHFVNLLQFNKVVRSII
jgi:hypothetical protein